MTIDLKDKPFGILIAKYKVGKTTNGMYIWRCICECGNIVDVTIGNLRSGITKSCGCLARNNATKHGHSKNNKMTSTYRSWYSMKDRCYNKNNVRHNNYAEKDIKVCDRWLDSFENFLDDMGECPLGYSLDRRKNDKGYNKENCRWATKIEQANNKSNNKFLTYKGKTQTQAQWARELGISEGGLTNRIKRKLPDEKIFYYGKIK